jgi:hypothetical protein
VFGTPFFHLVIIIIEISCGKKFGEMVENGVNLFLLIGERFV